MFLCYVLDTVLGTPQSQWELIVFKPILVDKQEYPLRFKKKKKKANYVVQLN